MNYAPLIEQALATAGRDLSLTELLAQVDVQNKSVPTLEELNVGLKSLGRESVTAEAYRKAISENHESMLRHLARSGIPLERQREILKRYAALIGKT
jgi:hypothetical protein